MKKWFMFLLAAALLASSVLLTCVLPAAAADPVEAPFSKMTTGGVGWWIDQGGKKDSADGYFSIEFQSIYSFSGIKFASHGGESDYVISYALYAWNRNEKTTLEGEPLFSKDVTYKSNQAISVDFGKVYEKGHYLFMISYIQSKQPNEGGNHFVVGVADEDPALPVVIRTNGTVNPDDKRVGNGFNGSLIVTDAPAGTTKFFDEIAITEKNISLTDQGDGVGFIMTPESYYALRFKSTGMVYGINFGIYVPGSGEGSAKFKCTLYPWNRNLESTLKGTAVSETELTFTKDTVMKSVRVSFGEDGQPAGEYVFVITAIENSEKGPLHLSTNIPIEGLPVEYICTASGKGGAPGDCLVADLVVAAEAELATLSVPAEDEPPIAETGAADYTGFAWIMAILLSAVVINKKRRIHI